MTPLPENYLVLNCQVVFCLLDHIHISAFNWIATPLFKKLIKFGFMLSFIFLKVLTVWQYLCSCKNWWNFYKPHLPSRPVTCNKLYSCLAFVPFINGQKELRSNWNVLVNYALTKFFLNRRSADVSVFLWHCKIQLFYCIILIFWFIKK